jgi:hypothetical protein
LRGCENRQRPNDGGQVEAAVNDVFHRVVR